MKDGNMEAKMKREGALANLNPSYDYFRSAKKAIFS
jgi:hypothetical protein